MAREIYNRCTDQVESFVLDEYWLDVTGSTNLLGSGKQIVLAEYATNRLTCFTRTPIGLWWESRKVYRNSSDLHFVSQSF